MENNNLENLDGLEGLFQVGAGSGTININNNPKLPTAEAMALIVRLELLGWYGDWIVYDNLD